MNVYAMLEKLQHSDPKSVANIAFKSNSMTIWKLKLLKFRTAVYLQSQFVRTVEFYVRIFLSKNSLGNIETLTLSCFSWSVFIILQVPKFKLEMQFLRRIILDAEILPSRLFLILIFWTAQYPVWFAFNFSNCVTYLNKVFDIDFCIFGVLV